MPELYAEGPRFPAVLIASCFASIPGPAILRLALAAGGAGSGGGAAVAGVTQRRH